MNERDSRQPGSEQEHRGKGGGRRTVLWAACGLYLIYLAYNLLRDYASGAAAKEGSEALCLVGGVIFVLVGIFLVVLAARQGFLSMRENAQEMARVEEEDRQAEEARRLREADADEDDDDVTEADGEPDDDNRTE